MQKNKDHKSSSHNWTPSHGGDRSNSSAGRKNSRSTSNTKK